MCSIAQVPLEVCSSIFQALFLSLRVNHLMFNTLLTWSYILSGVMLFKMVPLLTAAEKLGICDLMLLRAGTKS